MDRPARESKAEFWTRIDCEGRRDAAKAVEAELVATGAFKRTVQAALVQRFQPLDGRPTVAWMTPDSWACDRVDAKKFVSPQERHDLDCQWAHDHPDRSLEEAPTPGARLMLVMLREKPVLFAKEWAKCVARIEERERQRREHRRQNIRARREAKRQQAEAERLRIVAEQERVEAERKSAERKLREAERRERAAREAAEEEERERVRREQEAAAKAERERQKAERQERERREACEYAELLAAARAVQSPAEGDSEVL